MKRRGFFGLLAGVVTVPVTAIVAKAMPTRMDYLRGVPGAMTSTELSQVLDGANNRLSALIDVTSHQMNAGVKPLTYEDLQWAKEYLSVDRGPRMTAFEWASSIKQPILYPTWYQDRVMRRVFSGEKIP